MKHTHVSQMAALLCLAACGGEAKPVAAAHDGLPITEALEPYEWGSIARLHTLGRVFLASQPAPDDFRRAKDRGIKTIVDLRMPGENTEFDEPALIAELGLEYVNPGFASPDALTDELILEVREVLADEAKRPLLIHCKSGNRVGAVWLIHRVLDDKLAWDAALEEARTVGLESPALEAAAELYITRTMAGE